MDDGWMFFSTTGHGSCMTISLVGNHKLPSSMALGWLSIPSPPLSCSHCSFNWHEKELLILPLQHRLMTTWASGTTFLVL